MSSFNQLPLNSALKTNLQDLGYADMTPIQAQSLPHIFQGKDIVAQAKTGSGKTAAFALGLLNQLDVQSFRVQALVLCPTRELADQVAKEIRKLARAMHNVKVLTLCGGMPFGPQIGSLEHGAHIVVGTPGRIEEHLRKGTLKLNQLKTLVLDEADRMLEMGFQESIDNILEHAPSKRQNLLFSATYPDAIENMAARITRKPEFVRVENNEVNQHIHQTFYRLDENKHRFTLLQLILNEHKPKSTVVFCNTKRESQEIADELKALGFAAVALHGDLEQKVRDQVLVRFANNSASILVATDVAARGLDIDELDCVVNYQMARDHEVHVHRVGRTGRAGNQGKAFTLYTEKELYKLKQLEEYLGQDIIDTPIPDYALLKKPPFKPSMVTLQIDGGKKQKLRPGDIVGALTGDNGISGKQVGKIHVFDFCAYVAVERDAAKPALKKISEGKMKGRTFRVRRIRG